MDWEWRVTSQSSGRRTEWSKQRASEGFQRIKDSVLKKCWTFEEYHPIPCQVLEETTYQSRPTERGALNLEMMSTYQHRDVRGCDTRTSVTALDPTVKQIYVTSAHIREYENTVPQKDAQDARGLRQADQCHTTKSAGWGSGRACGKMRWSWGISWFSRSTPRWVSSRTHSFSSTNLRWTCFSSPFQGQVPDSQCRPMLLPTPARSLPLVEHTSPCSRPCHHSPRRVQGSISLLSSTSHGCVCLSPPLHASNSRSCRPVFLPPHVLLRLLPFFSCLSLEWSPLRFSFCLTPSWPSSFSMSKSFRLCSSSARLSTGGKANQHKQGTRSVRCEAATRSFAYYAISDSHWEQAVDVQRHEPNVHARTNAKWRFRGVMWGGQDRAGRWAPMLETREVDVWDQDSSPRLAVGSDKNNEGLGIQGKAEHLHAGSGIGKETSKRW